MNIDKCPHCGCDAEFTELTNGRYFQCGATLILSTGEWVRGPKCFEAEITRLRALLKRCHPANIWDKCRMYYTDPSPTTYVDNPLVKWHTDNCKAVDEVLNPTTQPMPFSLKDESHDES